MEKAIYLVIKEQMFWTGSAWSSEHTDGQVFQNFEETFEQALLCGGEVLYLPKPYKAPCLTLQQIKDKTQRLIR